MPLLRKKETSEDPEESVIYLDIINGDGKKVLVSRINSVGDIEVGEMKGNNFSGEPVDSVEDFIEIFGEDLISITKKRDPYLHRLYKNQLQEECEEIYGNPMCVLEQLSYPVLIASHIKPYRTCINEDNVGEAIDYLNGLALSPTYDKLFDQGYITFTDNGELICGTQLTAYTWERLRINPNAKNVLRIYPEKREKYLDYHRNYVFQDDINDLI